jgi:two-component system, chemotaxis family, response regulator Rcp1
LLIEDNRADVFIIEEALRAYAIDYELQVLTDGEVALGWLDALDSDSSSALPDLILLDLNLPKRSGLEILDRIRHGKRNPDIPVIIVTSSGTAADMAGSKELGATAYFQKSASLEEFLKIGQLVQFITQPT